VESGQQRSGRDTNTLAKVGSVRGKKMLKMKVDPEMYMKTKDRLTQ
jgi:hypothetical protein